MEIKDLKPQRVFEIFDEITRIPRPSKKEEKIRAYLLDFAKKHGIEAKTDAVGNVVMTLPATPGHEDAPTVILQGHQDMVCESNDKSFDFNTQPIPAYVDGEWVKTHGTTLGADNGIGVAASLAVMTDPSVVHGPIEALFTMDEETGMTGAFGLGDDMIHGDILINLDSEDDAELYVGCAGGVDTVATFTYSRSFAPKDFRYFRLDVAKVRAVTRVAISIWAAPTPISSSPASSSTYRATTRCRSQRSTEATSATLFPAPPTQCLAYTPRARRRLWPSSISM